MPQSVNEKNSEAFGMTILKQFPNGSLSKEIYRQKVNDNERRLKASNPKQRPFAKASMDTTKNTAVEQE